METGTGILRVASALALMLLLAGCGEDAAMANKPVVRGLRTVVVQDQERNTTRNYPSVLQPSSISNLSFEISGKLTEVNLDVGQVVKAGDVLARIDPTNLNLQVDSAEAAVRRAQSGARTARDDNQRKVTLLAKGVISKASADQARNALESAEAELVQATKQLDTARENLKKAVLKAPFDGVIHAVEVDNFSNVAPGAAIASIYSIESFEASFSVSYEVINMMTVGKRAVVRLADNPSVVLAGQVSELGARADTVSSFPVVVALGKIDPGLKAGMAVEVSLAFAVQAGEGFILPLSVLALEGKVKPPNNNTDPGKANVYVFDKATNTVNRREVTIAGVRENALIIVAGLKAGERVASAGVSFLRDGQTVKLLANAAQE